MKRNKIALVLVAALASLACLGAAPASAQLTTSGPHAVDMMRQAQLVLDGDTAVRAEAGVEMLLFHTLIEPNVPASHQERGFGMIIAGFWPKPAICVVARAWGAPPLC